MCVSLSFLVIVFGCRPQSIRMSLSSEVALCVVPGRVEHEGFAEEHLDFVIAPALCGEGLEEDDNVLGEIVSIG